MSKRKHLRGALIVAAAVLPVTSRYAKGQTDYFWNQTAGGAGTWDTVSSNWASVAGGGNDHVWASDGTERANFGNTGGAVTIQPAGVTAYGVNVTASNYIFSGGTLTLAGTGGVINNTSATTFNGVIAGTVGLSKTGGGTLTLGTVNTYTGATSITGGQLTAIAQLGGSPLSSGPLNLSMATLRLNSVGVATTTTVGDLTVLGASNTWSGASNVIIDNTNAGFGFTTTLAAGNLVRGGQGSVLAVTPVTANLGNGNGETLTFTNGNALLTNGILPAWFVTQTSGTNTAVDYTTYGANGVATATYTSTDITTSTNTSVVNQSAPATAAGNVAAYALKSNAAIDLAGNTMTLGDGTAPAGLILNAGGGVTNGNITFGNAEGVVFVQGTTTLGSSGNTISSNGLTITASGTANTNIGATIVDGTSPTKLILTGVTSGTGFTLGSAGNNYTGGTIISVNTGASQNIVLGSDTAFGTGKVVNILAPGSSSPQIQATAPRKIANDMDLNGGVTWTGTNAQTYSGAINIINAATGGQRTLNVSSSGLTVTFGDPTTPKTITLGNPVANGGDGIGKEVIIAVATGSTFIGNDVYQDPGLGGGTASGSVQYSGGGTMQVNALNTYSGGTDLNSGVSGQASAIQFNHSYNTGDLSGPFGTGPLRGNSSTPMNLQPVGGNRTLANPLALGGGGIAFTNATGDPSSITMTGPISLSTASGRTIFTSLAPGATLTLGDPNAPSTITGSATAGQVLILSGTATTGSNFTVINDVIQNNGATPLIVTITNTTNQDSTVTLNALNTYTGGTNLIGSGTIIRLPVSSNDIGGAATAGPFGASQISINNGTNQHLRPVGGNRMISNAITMTTGFAMDNATGENFNLTFSGAITMTNNRFISNGFASGTSGGTMVIGHSAAPSTVTLPVSGNFTLSLAALAGPIVMNDVIQDATTFAGIVAINPNAGNQNGVTLNGLNTYTGGTTIGTSGTFSGGITNVGISSNGSAGPFGSGTVTFQMTAASPSPAPVISPLGADRTVTNAIALNSNFMAANSTALNLNLYGPLTMGTTGRTIFSNMVTGSALNLGNPASPQAMTLSSQLTLSSTLAPGAGGLIVSGNVIQNGSAAGSIAVTGGATVQFLGTGLYTGGTTLTQGTIGLGIDSTGGIDLNVASGPLGTGTLNVNPSGGQNASISALNGPRFLGNSIIFNGTPLIISGSNDINLAGTVNLNSGNRGIQVDNPAGSTISGAIIGVNAGLQKSGTGTLTLTATNTYNGVTAMLGGVLSVSSSSNLGDASAPNNLLFNGGTLRATGPVTSNSRSVAMNGAGTIDAQAAVSLGDFNGVGSLTKTGTAPLTIKSAHIGNLTVSNGTLAVAPNGTAAGVAVVNSTTVAGGAQLDLSDNHLVDHTTGVGTWTGSNYTAITGLIKSGRNGGSWDGSGIITSQSTAASGNFTTLGVASAQQVKGLASATSTGVWAGQTVTGSDALVMYTYGGDANLDGKINVDDYGRIDFNVNLGTSGWFNGDFNYDGKINVDDYGIIDFNVGIQGAPFFTAGGTGGGSSSGLSGVSAVPEPATLSVLSLGAAALLGRRRRARSSGQ